MNAKGLILKAFEQYRLKTCIDFKPWEGEKDYISVFKGSGCWSYVGNRQRGLQQLSIGANCDRIATIQHEFLHALGFWHEQSRSDRDDYVSIVWDRIQTGQSLPAFAFQPLGSVGLAVEHPFQPFFSLVTFFSDLDLFFTPGGIQNLFGDFFLIFISPASSLSFMDTCSFELENVCGMIQSSDDNSDWQRLSQVAAGPATDHTNMGECEDSGYFMHFNTSAGAEGSTAVLESRILYPKRGFQCLQFYLYSSGHESDRLSVWVREYTSAHPNGTLRLIEEIKASPASYWQLHHVSLDTTSKFRVVFEGVKGSGSSRGGLSIDDINLSETQCPHHVWHIRNFTHLLDTSPAGQEGRIYSPPFYSTAGYAFQVGLYVNGTTASPFNLAIYWHLISGANDDHLQWPCAWQQGTMVLLDQHPDIRQRMSNQRSITTDPLLLDTSSNSFWGRPDEVGSTATFPNGTTFMRGPGLGTSAFLTHQRLRSRDFIKDDSIYILLTMEDISHLLSTQPSASPTVVTNASNLCPENPCENDGVCVVVDRAPVCRCPAGDNWWYMGEKCERKGTSQENTVIAVSSTIAVFVVMLIVTITTAVCLKKKYRKGKEHGEKLTLED
ncbi:MEP1B protein, partial [Psilopogon haemacephalus]|nr:MEP1B protein [Psilopogon haemacephalus]